MIFSLITEFGVKLYFWDSLFMTGMGENVNIFSTILFVLHMYLKRRNLYMIS